MAVNIKNQQSILQKFGITALNEMQKATQAAFFSDSEIILLSPTGTGKTLAFLLPLMAHLNPKSKDIQALILVPSRELAIQIAQVAREMGSGYKINAVYGGRSGTKDKMELKHAPALLIGTPGRVADHIRRENILTDGIETLVLDEFDKSLEVGFAQEMREILEAVPSLKKKVLTSATQEVQVPNFVGLSRPTVLSYLHEKKELLKLQTVVSPTKDKLDSLVQLLGHVGEGSGIIFCNFKDTIQFVSNFLQEQQINHGCFHGGLEQIQRERALVKFRNGTQRFLLATDLAARGIDVPELDFIIHYQLPHTQAAFIHRNGRTARMHSQGIAYLLRYEDQDFPDFIEENEIISLSDSLPPSNSQWNTLYISGGRKDKISKGDIAGLFFKQGGLQKGELGRIELRQDCAFVAVPIAKTKQLVQQLNNSRLKKKKVRISLME